MAPDVIQVQYKDLAVIEQRISAQAEAVAAVEQQVRTASAPLIDGGWTGKGSQAFTSEVQQELLPTLQRLQAALQEGQMVLSEISARFEEAEITASDLFGGAIEAVPASAAPATPPTPSSNPFANFSALDWIQLILDLFGFIPVAGEVADLINALVSAARGDWAGAGLSLAAMWPAGGQAATIAKIGAKYGDEVAAVIKNLDEVITGGGRSADEIAGGARAVDTLRNGGNVRQILDSGRTVSEREWRDLIDNAPSPEAADNLRYQRHEQDRILRGEEPMPRDQWQAAKDRLEANRVRGRADEDGALNDIGVENNNYGRTDADGNSVSPTTHTARVDGQNVTTRPDAVTDGHWVDVKSVDVSKATPDNPQVVYNTRQQRAELAGAQQDGGKGVAVIISGPDRALVRPSSPLADSGPVFHRNPQTGEWFQWNPRANRGKGGWSDQSVPAADVRQRLNEKPTER